MACEPDHRPSWRQLSITFTQPRTAEQHFLAHLGPAIADAETQGLITAWFFIRKHQWRMRCLPAEHASPAAVTAALRDTAHRLRDKGIARCTEAVYEPETHAFGGDEAMHTAHHLFHADSRGILTHLTSDGAGHTSGRRRELSLLLCTALLRAAGLDRYEQGDVWARVAAHRPNTTPAPPQQRNSLTAAVHRLTTVDTASGTLLRTGALASADDWLTAFEHTGRTLKSLADNGHLARGLRAVATHHVLFHWNRLGLPATTQANLAHAATDTAFADPRDPRQ
ncbi:thiopeptide-type bacteriocin biosynthesis protein [Lipingzhangella halophila]|uniref:Thiopeptide-type bacteriocin biosynthesis protein n=1 Tax=Lipingzhangella halophila TaxID=1783352 RepID=A0A7W7W194_9ACTN|nr:thiopeptide-type bacteriocin biosynthesis protein [Lipingzhangella halophila]MBB4930702.1 thiopeptide-type bacteriocin biosynthesis protein [Lipingzhangella halophila]